MLVVFVLTQIIALAKGGKGSKSIIGAEKCEALYFVVFAIQYIFPIVTGLIVYLK